MDVLGYLRFGAAGGDIGSHVSRHLELGHPTGSSPSTVRTWACPSSPEIRRSGDPVIWRTSARGARLAGRRRGLGRERGRLRCHTHRTRPQTADFGLTDSPVGLAAWIVEKLRAWSDCDGDAERSFTKDETLTLCWLKGTTGSSMRVYRSTDP
ncbi:hypothetical protein ACFVTP_09355 [Streptomyces celluloflavus]|uniref:hypothetical protein n=1 Tax=Streptomyces celluloflavus TaxID=58344 RepID=UPI0036DD722C